MINYASAERLERRQRRSWICGTEHNKNWLCCLATDANYAEWSSSELSRKLTLAPKKAKMRPTLALKVATVGKGKKEGKSTSFMYIPENWLSCLATNADYAEWGRAPGVMNSAPSLVMSPLFPSSYFSCLPFHLFLVNFFFASIPCFLHFLSLMSGQPAK